MSAFDQSPWQRLLSPRRTLNGDPLFSLKGINTTTLPDGCLCWVQDATVRSLYVFLRESTDPELLPLFVAPNAGPGRWQLLASGLLGGCLIVANPAVPREYSICVDAAGALVVSDLTAGADRYAVQPDGDLVMLGDYDFVPSADNSGEVGTDALRFSRVRAVAVVSGDLGFDDESCAQCGRAFQINEDLLLKVVRIEKDAAGKRLTYSVPIHRQCKL